MNKDSIIAKLRARETALLEEVDEVRTILKAMERPTRLGRSKEDMAAMREKLKNTGN